jgi:hypothetical protein
VKMCRQEDVSLRGCESVDQTQGYKKISDEGKGTVGEVDRKHQGDKVRHM